jgi:hypothetical protein
VALEARHVQTTHEPVTCEICGRSLLRGEIATTFRDGPVRHQVCELCVSRAFAEGWSRDGATIGDPAQTRSARARSLVGRLRARLDDGHGAERQERAWPVHGGEGAPPERHVHAVPAEAGGQLARAVALFNGSEHAKMIGGVIRSLGAPHVNISPSHEELVVEILIAWELCWYRFEADLDGEVVRRRAQGYELSELGGALRKANAAADPDGRLALAL